MSDKSKKFIENVEISLNFDTSGMDEGAKEALNREKKLLDSFLELYKKSKGKEKKILNGFIKNQKELVDKQIAQELAARESAAKTRTIYETKAADSYAKVWENALVKNAKRQASYRKKEAKESEQELNRYLKMFDEADVKLIRERNKRRQKERSQNLKDEQATISMYEKLWAKAEANIVAKRNSKTRSQSRAEAKAAADEDKRATNRIRGMLKKESERELLLKKKRNDSIAKQMQVQRVADKNHSAVGGLLTNTIKAEDAQRKALIKSLKRQTKAIEKETKERESNSNKSFSTRFPSGVSGAMFNIAKYAVAGIPFAAAMGVGNYIKDLTVGGAELNKQMFKLKAITGATGSQMKQMATTIRSVGAQFGYSAKEVGGFVESLAKMGMSADDINKSASSIAAFAKVTGSDLSKSAEIVTQTIRAFGREFDEADYFVNEMTKTINGSALNLDKYATIMGYVASAAQETGSSFEQTNSMIMLLTNSGLKASQVGTSLRNIMGKMSESGVSLYSTLESLSKQTYTYADAVEDVGQRGANALTTLVNKFKELEGYTRKNILNIGTAEGAAAIMMQSPLARLQKGANLASIYAETFLSGSIGGYDSDFAKTISNKSASEKREILNNILGSVMTRDEFSGYNIESKQGLEALMKAAAEQLVKESPLLATELGISKRAGYYENKNTGEFEYKQDRLNDEAMKEVFEANRKGITKAVIAKMITDVSDEISKNTNAGKFTHLYTGGDMNSMRSGQLEYGQALLTEKLMRLGLSQSEIEEVLKSQSGNLLNPNLSNLTTKEANVKRLSEIQESIKNLQSKSDFNTFDFQSVKQYEEEMKAVLEFLCAAYGKNSQYCKQLSSFGGGGGDKPTKPMTPMSILDDELKKINDGESAAFSELQAQMETLRGLEGTPEYEEFSRKMKATYGASMKSIFDVMGAQLDVALAKTEEDYSQYEKDIEKYYDSMISGEADAEKIATLKSNKNTELEKIRAMKSGLLSKKQKGIDYITKKVARNQLPNSNTGFRTTAIDESILDQLGFIGDKESEYTIQKTNKQAVIDAAKQRLEGNLDITKTKRYMDDIKKLENEAFEEQKEYEKNKADYYSALAELYAKKEAEVDEQYKQSKSSIKSDRELIETGALTPEQKQIELTKNDKKLEALEKEYLAKKKSAKKGATSAITTSETSMTASNADKPSELKQTLATIYSETQEFQDLAFNEFQSYQDRMLQATIDRIEKELEYEQEKYDKQNSLNAGALELGLISQSSYAAKQIEIENEFTERKNELLEEQFEAEKEAEIKRAKLNLAQKLAEIAMNVLLANSKQGIVGLIGAPATIAAFSAAAAAQSVMEINAIKQKEFIPNQFAKGGWLVGDSHSNGGIPFTIGGKAGFEAEGGEFMINKYSASKYRKEIEEINSGTFNSNSYFSDGGEATALLRVIAENLSTPVRAYVTSKDLKNDEIARKSINQKVRVNG